MNKPLIFKRVALVAGALLFTLILQAVIEKFIIAEPAPIRSQVKPADYMPDLEIYLNQFPDGKWAEYADKRYKELKSLYDDLVKNAEAHIDFRKTYEEDPTSLEAVPESPCRFIIKALEINPGVDSILKMAQNHGCKVESNQ